MRSEQCTEGTLGASALVPSNLNGLRRTLAGPQVLARSSAPELEMGIGQYPIVEDVGVGQLKQAHGGDSFSRLGGRFPDARLKHGIQVCELGSHASFAQHDASDVTAEVQRGRARLIWDFSIRSQAPTSLRDTSGNHGVNVDT
jgi:hypothetical protein